MTKPNPNSQPETPAPTDHRPAAAQRQLPPLWFKVENGELCGAQCGDAFAERMASALGIADSDVGNELLATTASGLLPDVADREAVARQMNHLAAFAEEMAPRNAMEAQLVMQMYVINAKLGELSRQMTRADRVDALETYSNLVNKFARTAVAQAEAWQKLRSGGKQQVVVKHVYVDARTANLYPAGGEGGGRQPSPQPLGLGAHGPALLGEDASGYALSIAEDARQAQVLPSRGAFTGSAEGAGERQLETRLGDERGQGRTEANVRSTARRARVPADAGEVKA